MPVCLVNTLNWAFDRSKGDACDNGIKEDLSIGGQGIREGFLEEGTPELAFKGWLGDRQLE